MSHKVICECGGSYTDRNKPHHIKTKKHIRFIEEREKENKEPNIEDAIKYVEALSKEQREALFKHFNMSGAGRPEPPSQVDIIIEKMGGMPLLEKYFKLYYEDDEDAYTEIEQGFYSGMTLEEAQLACDIQNMIQTICWVKEGVDGRYNRNHRYAYFKGIMDYLDKLKLPSVVDEIKYFEVNRNIYKFLNEFDDKKEAKFWQSRIPEWQKDALELIEERKISVVKDNEEILRTLSSQPDLKPLYNRLMDL